MTDPIHLLPCPFCGGPPCPFVGHSGNGGGLREKEYWAAGICVSARVFCHECGAESEHVEDVVCSLDEARELLPKAVKFWQDRSLRHLDLYLAGEADGHNLYPRPDKK